MQPSPARTVLAAAVAGVVSGLPSTVHALVTGRDPLAATRAIGEVLGRPTAGRALAAHAVLSLGWTAVLARSLPPRRTALWGAAAGAAVAALDLGLVGRRLPPIRALPQGPQWADHVLFGAAAGALLARP